MLYQPAAQSTREFLVSVQKRIPIVSNAICTICTICTLSFPDDISGLELVMVQLRGFRQVFGR